MGQAAITYPASMFPARVLSAMSPETENVLQFLK